MSTNRFRSSLSHNSILSALPSIFSTVSPHALLIRQSRLISSRNSQSDLDLSNCITFTKHAELYHAHAIRSRGYWLGPDSSLGFASMAWPNVYGLDASKFQPHASTPPQRSTIVLIHDAFHTPEHFEPLATELISSGWRVLTPRLPSSGTGQQEAALEADVQAISAAAGPDMASGRNLVLVMHGYSSIRKRNVSSPSDCADSSTTAGSMAANRLDRYSLQRPRAGHVVKLIFFAGIIVNRNESFEDVFRASWLSSEVLSNTSHCIGPKH